MRKNTKIFNRLLVSFFFLLIIYPTFSHSQGLNFRKYAGEFMEIGVDARAQAMGGAFTAICGDIAATYYNPAGLIDLRETQVSFMHTQQMLASVNYDYLAFGRRQSTDRVLAVSLIRLGVDNIKDSRQAKVVARNGDWRIDWNKIKEFNASDYIFSLSLAQNWKKGWALGGNIKLIRRNLADHSANGLGFDFSLRKSFPFNLAVGANLRNATTTLIAWDTGEKELVKPALFLGSTYLLRIGKINSQFQPTFDVIFRGEDRRKSTTANLGLFSFDFAAGMEYAYRQTLFVRAGLDEISRLNMGVGIQIPHIRIDYAFTSYDNELGNSHRIGLLIKI